MLADRRVVLGVGGSVAAYKAAELVRELRRGGAEVRVILTAAARRFVGDALFAGLTGMPVARDLFAPQSVDHIALARWGQVGVVAPATADILARAAAGVADDYLTTWLLAFPGPVFFAPAMNRHMWSHPAVQRNVARLRADGASVVDPGWGPLGAVGEGEGWGRLADPSMIAAAVVGAVGRPPRAELPPPGTDLLRGRHVLVTAGPTREPLDPVRFLSNHSSGKMGYALAASAREMGARVTLVTGPVALEAPSSVTCLRVGTALEMRDAVQRAGADADVVVAAAAVADWRPAEVSETKIKKQEAGAVLRLVRNPDILAELGLDKRGRVLVGFAAEAGAGPEEALRKLRAKHLDLCVFNAVGAGGAFGAETNTVVIWDALGHSEAVGPLPKRAVADRILQRAADCLARD